MKFKIKSYSFEVNYYSPARVPGYLKSHVLIAVENTFASIPPKILKENLKRAETYILNISVVSKAEIKKLNTQYRGKTKATDVLSFSRLKNQKFISALPDLGDVILCFDVAKSQAKDWGNTLPEEMRRLTVHGILHLFGYDHEISAKEEKKMFTLQEAILKKIKKKYYSRIASIGSKREALTAGKTVAKRIKRVATK